MVIQHVIQQDQSDCGVACLASILHYFQREVPTLPKLRELSGTTRSGTTMLGLAEVARQYGLVAEGYEADLESLRDCDELVILHVIKDLKWTHFIVCYGYNSSKKSWKIGDPAYRSIMYLSDEDLSKIWTSKKLLIFKNQSPKGKKISTRKRKLRWLKTLIREDINILGLALFLGICMSILGLSTAIFSQKLLDDILPSKDMNRLFVGLTLLCVLLFVRSGFSLIRQIFLYRQSRDFNNRILDFFLGRLIRLPMNFFTNRKTGDLVARLNDIQRIQKTISSLAANLTIDVIMILVATVAVVAYNMVIGLFMLAWIPVYGLIVWRYNNPIIVGQELVMKNHAMNEHNFVQVVRGILPIKIHRKEQVYLKLSHRIFDKLQKAIYHLGIIGSKFAFFSEIIGTVFLVMVLGWTSIMVYDGDMTIGTLIAILQMTGLLMTSTGSLALSNIQLQEARIAFERMYEFTSLELEEVDLREKVFKFTEFKNLKVSELSFRYPGQSRLLDGVSFEVTKGELISIWGEIGSGKSTIFNLLQRHYLPESGYISINDREILTFPLGELRTRIGVVPQNPTIFTGTLSDNIFMGQPPNSEEELQSFLEKYNLYEIFQQFPHGFSTILEEDGINVSGGQRRFINLARTLYNSPQLLLLDEPTSDFDQNSVHFLFELLEKLKNDCAIIVLTHDVRLAHQSDRIYILEGGKIEQSGSHMELMTCDNLYSRSWEDYIITT